MEKLISEFASCSLCKMTVQDVIASMCGHVFCKPCKKKAFYKKTQRKVSCPLCARTISLRQRDLDKYAMRYFEPLATLQSHLEALLSQDKARPLGETPDVVASVQNKPSRKREYKRISGRKSLTASAKFDELLNEKKIHSKLLPEEPVALIDCAESPDEIAETPARKSRRPSKASLMSSTTTEIVTLVDIDKSEVPTTDKTVDNNHINLSIEMLTYSESEAESIPTDKTSIDSDVIDAKMDFENNCGIVVPNGPNIDTSGVTVKEDMEVSSTSGSAAELAPHADKLLSASSTADVNFIAEINKSKKIWETNVSTVLTPDVTVSKDIASNFESALGARRITDIFKQPVNEIVPSAETLTVQDLKSSEEDVAISSPVTSPDNFSSFHAESSSGEVESTITIKKIHSIGRVTVEVLSDSDEFVAKEEGIQENIHTETDSESVTDNRLSIPADSSDSRTLSAEDDANALSEEDLQIDKWNEKECADVNELAFAVDVVTRRKSLEENIVKSIIAKTENVLPTNIREDMCEDRTPFKERFSVENPIAFSSEIIDKENVPLCPQQDEIRQDSIAEQKIMKTDITSIILDFDSNIADVVTSSELDETVLEKNTSKTDEIISDTEMGSLHAKNVKIQYDLAEQKIAKTDKTSFVLSLDSNRAGAVTDSELEDAVLEMNTSKTDDHDNVSDREMGSLHTKKVKMQHNSAEQMMAMTDKTNFILDSVSNIAGVVASSELKDPVSEMKTNENDHKIQDNSAERKKAKTDETRLILDSDSYIADLIRGSESEEIDLKMDTSSTDTDGYDHEKDYDMDGNIESTFSEECDVKEPDSSYEQMDTTMNEGNPGFARIENVLSSQSAADFYRKTDNELTLTNLRRITINGDINLLKCTRGSSSFTIEFDQSNFTTVIKMKEDENIDPKTVVKSGKSPDSLLKDKNAAEILEEVPEVPEETLEHKIVARTLKLNDVYGEVLSPADAKLVKEVTSRLYTADKVANSSTGFYQVNLSDSEDDDNDVAVDELIWHDTHTEDVMYAVARQKVKKTMDSEETRKRKLLEADINKLTTASAKKRKTNYSVNGKAKTKSLEVKTNRIPHFPPFYRNSGGCDYKRPITSTSKVPSTSKDMERYTEAKVNTSTFSTSGEKFTNSYEEDIDVNTSARPLENAKWKLMMKLEREEDA